MKQQYASVAEVQKRIDSVNNGYVPCFYDMETGEDGCLYIRPGDAGRFQLYNPKTGMFNVFRVIMNDGKLDLRFDSAKWDGSYDMARSAYAVLLYCRLLHEIGKAVVDSAKQAEKALVA